MKNTNKQGFTGFDDLSAVDPAVESLLNQGQRRNIESHLPKNLRSQRKKERERAQKRLANRINLDLPVDLKEAPGDPGQERRCAGKPAGCLPTLRPGAPVGDTYDQPVGLQDFLGLPKI